MEGEMERGRRNRREMKRKGEEKIERGRRKRKIKRG